MIVPSHLVRLLGIFIFLIFSLVYAFSQSCQGELGLELFFEDFGSGSGPGPSLPPGTTTYTYGRIGGGNYVVTNTTGINGSLWHDAPDHTPDDTDGYCLLFDASADPGIFYKRLFEDLCENTEYIFSCYVANIVRPFACGGNSIEPDLKFSLYDPTTMMELGSVTTGGIATTEEMTWNQYSISFNTNQSQADILIEVTNNAPGGCGNDLAIDDFKFNICNPVKEQEFDLCTLPGNSIQVGDEIYSSPGFYQTIIDLPNSCNDSIIYTTLTGDEPNNTNQFISLCPGDSIDINGVFYSNNTIIIDTISANGSCIETLSYIIRIEEEVSTLDQIYLCAGEGILISDNWVYEEGIYPDTLVSSKGCDSFVVYDVEIVPEVEFTITSEKSCWNSDDGTIILEHIDGGVLPYTFFIDDIEYSFRDSFNNISPGNHSFTIQDGNNCVFSETIEVAEIPEFQLIYSSVFLPCESDSILLTVDLVNADHDQVQWNWSTGYSGDYSYISTPDDITLEVSNQCQTRTEQIDVQTEQFELNQLMYIPNAFTPNSDGTNDCFKVYPTEDVDVLDFHIQIFDRWGNLIYESLDINFCWDGFFKGSPMNPGVYTWWLNTKVSTCRQEIEFIEKGDFTIIL